MEKDARVVALEREVAAEVHSASRIRSFAHAVVEVVTNAIEAEASSVGVACDWKGQSFVVEDDGCGMCASDAAKIGLAICTSKESSIGVRGRTIYDLGHLALIEISTLPRSMGPSSQKAIYGGLPTSNSGRLLSRKSPGTSVRVSEFLYNCPVRRRLSAEMRESKAMADLREVLLQLLVPFPQIQFTLRNSDASLVLRLDKNRSRQIMIWHLFGDLAESLVPLDFSASCVEVLGHAVCPGTPNASSKCQFLYVNRRLVESNEIHEVMDQVYEGACGLLRSLPQKPLYRPAYLLNISVEQHVYESIYGSVKRTVVFKHKDEVLEVIKKGMLSAWKEELPIDVLQCLERRLLGARQPFRGGNQGVSPLAHVLQGEVFACEQSKIAGVGKKRKRSFIMSPVLVSKRRGFRCSLSMDCGRSATSPKESDRQFSSQLADRPKTQSAENIDSGSGRRQHVVARDNEGEEQVSEYLNFTPSRGSSPSIEDADACLLSDTCSTLAGLDLNQSDDRHTGSSVHSMEDNRSLSDSWPSGCDSDSPVQTRNSPQGQHLSSGDASGGGSQLLPRTTGRSNGDEADHRIPISNKAENVQSCRTTECAMENDLFLSAPPFYKPVCRRVHRNPRTSLKTSCITEFTSVNERHRSSVPTIQNSHDCPATEQCPTDRSALLVTPSPETLHVLPPTRPRKGDKRVLSSLTDIDEWNRSWKPREVEITNLSAGTNNTSAALHRNVLENSDIIGSADNKFILIRSGDNILAVDQHAADERVKLEQLEKRITELMNSDALSEKLNPPIVLNLTPFEQEIFRDNERRIGCWGWKGVMDILTDTVLLTHHPCLLDTHFTQTDLKIYLHALDMTCGAMPFPPCVHRLLKSRACRTAVKFGDELTQTQQYDLVHQLHQTHFCFLCAHGRPTVVPLINLHAI